MTRRLPKIFLFLVCCALRVIAQAPVPAVVQILEPLVPGKTVFAEIAAGTRHIYQLPPASDHYLELTLIKPGLKGSFRLLSPAGKRLQAEDDLIGTGKENSIAALTREERPYQVEIYAYRNQPSQRYELTLSVWRKPIGNDTAVAELREKFFEALTASREDRPADARAAYDRALQLQQIVYGPVHQRNAFVLNQRAIAETELGELGQAAQSYEQALRIYERLPFDSRINKTLLGLGEVLSMRGEYWRALPFLERAIAVEEQARNAQSGELAFLLLTQARVLFMLGEYDDAAVPAERGLTLAEQVFGKDVPHTANYLELFAKIAHARGDFVSAESLYRQALKANQNGAGESQGLTRLLLMALANLAHDRGQFEEARKLFAQVAQSAEKSPQRQFPPGFWFRRAATELASGNRQNALAFSREELEQRNNALRLNLNYGTEAQKLAFAETLTAAADFAFWLHLAHLPDNEQAQKLAAFSVIQFKGRIQEALVDQLATMRSRLGADKQSLLVQWQTVTARLARLALDVSSSAESLNTLLAEREKLEGALIQNSGGSFAPMRVVTLEEITAAIPAKAALIEFAVYRSVDVRAPLYQQSFGPPRYAACVLKKAGVAQCFDLGDKQAIDETLDGWRRALRDPQRADFNQRGWAVAEKIFTPLRASLADAEHLLIAPDGALNLIPFEALPDTANGHLIERFAISYLSTGRDLLRLQTPRTTSQAPLVVADPEFGVSNTATVVPSAKPQRARTVRRNITTASELSQIHFAQLYGSALESRKIKELFPETLTLTGAQATETALRQAAAPRLLHIATHGFFLNPVKRSADNSPMNPLNPMLRSGLALAGANLHVQRKGNDDGLLTALEAAGLNLWGTQLVTLSACDTGLGEVRTGEGVYGLRRAFTLAGAETLMMSLWPVNDLVARELMSSFYTRLRQGQGRGASLRQTQLEMLQRPNRRHPFYWASFIQAGEWRSLSGTPNQP